MRWLLAPSSKPHWRGGKTAKGESEPGDPAQRLPRVDPGVVPVRPLDLERVVPDARNLERPDVGGDPGGIEDLAAGALLDAARAGALVAQLHRRDGDLRASRPLDHELALPADLDAVGRLGGGRLERDAIEKTHGVEERAGCAGYASPQRAGRRAVSERGARPAQPLTSSRIKWRFGRWLSTRTCQGGEESRPVHERRGAGALVGGVEVPDGERRREPEHGRGAGAVERGGVDAGGGRPGRVHAEG